MSGTEDARLGLTHDGPRTSSTSAPRLSVLGSGSRGNCSVIDLDPDGGGGDPGRLILIDAGLSPRATAERLARLGLSMAQVGGVLITHLDRDHCHEGWCGSASPLPPHTEFFVCESHFSRARRIDLAGGRCRVFEGEFCTRNGVHVRPELQSHDELGTVAFRLAFGMPGHLPQPTLGFATDIGMVTNALIDLLAGVDVLAIESNYCPRRQAASNRPDFLKRRIMGGAGHLSNHQALQAIHRIGPREHVILLHLSQDCNDPAEVALLHEGADYTLTVAMPDHPTRWIPIRCSRTTHVPRPFTRTGSLFLW
jgi:phosphoribosyl 1,2-cyclic phosphodiesterase